MTQSIPPALPPPHPIPNHGLPGVSARKGEDGLIYFKRCFHEENLPYQFCGLPDSQLRLGYDHVVSCMGTPQ